MTSDFRLTRAVGIAHCASAVARRLQRKRTVPFLDRAPRKEGARRNDKMQQPASNEKGEGSHAALGDDSPT